MVIDSCGRRAMLSDNCYCSEALLSHEAYIWPINVSVSITNLVSIGGASRDRFSDVV